jgi:hypothetical protein
MRSAMPEAEERVCRLAWHRLFSTPTGVSRLRLSPIGTWWRLLRAPDIYPDPVVRFLGDERVRTGRTPGSVSPHGDLAVTTVRKRSRDQGFRVTERNIDPLVDACAPSRHFGLA